MADKTYAGSIKNTGAQVVKAPFSGDNKKGNGTVKTGNDLRGSKNKKDHLTKQAPHSQEKRKNPERSTTHGHRLRRIVWH